MSTIIEDGSLCCLGCRSRVERYTCLCTEEETSGSYRLRGRLGVFAPGQLELSFVDASGTPQGEAVAVAVGPAEEVALEQLLPAETGASELRISLESAAGSPLGEVAQLALPTTGG